jgi:hypothetical protein
VTHLKRLAILSLMFAVPAFAADQLTGAKQQIKTGSKSDVQAQQSGADGNTIANVQSNNSTPGSGGGEQVLSGNVSTAAPSYTSGNFAMPWLDLAGRMHIVDDLQLPASLGQQTAANSVSVVLASNQPTLPVAQGAPTGAANAMGTQTSIASSGTTAIACATGLTVSTPMKLYRVRVSGAAMARCVVRYNNNGSFTNWVNLMTSPAKPTDEATLPAGFVGLTTGSTGTQAIEANCTNFDAAAQDFNCDVSYCIAASGC